MLFFTSCLYVHFFLVINRLHNLRIYVKLDYYFCYQVQVQVHRSLTPPATSVIWGASLHCVQGIYLWFYYYSGLSSFCLGEEKKKGREGVCVLNLPVRATVSKMNYLSFIMSLNVKTIPLRLGLSCYSGQRPLRLQVQVGFTSP